MTGDPQSATRIVNVECPISRWPGWNAAATFQTLGQKEVLSSITVFPGSNRESARAGEWRPHSPQAREVLQQSALRKEILRDVPIARLHQLAKSVRGNLLVRELRLPKPLTVHPGEEGAGREDREFLEIAVRYAALMATGTTRYRKLMAEELRTTSERVRDLIRECRERGLLTKSTQGQAGGRLTPKSEALLKKREWRSPG